MLATIANGGIYHNAHVDRLDRHNTQNTPRRPAQDHQLPGVQLRPHAEHQHGLAGSVRDVEGRRVLRHRAGTAMSNGQEIIAKTGTTDTAQSAFYIGAIPNQALAVAIFTNQQGRAGRPCTASAAIPRAAFGGTWPAMIWHTYAENMFVPLGVEPFPTPVFTGQTWNQVPPNLRNVGKKPKKHDHGGENGGRGGGQGGNPTPCDPQVVTCTRARRWGWRRQRQRRRFRRRQWRRSGWRPGDRGCGPRRDRPAPVGPPRLQHRRPRRTRKAR